MTMSVIKLFLALFLLFTVSCKSADKLALTNLYPYQKVNESHPIDGMTLPKPYFNVFIREYHGLGLNFGRDTLLVYLHGNGENVRSVLESGILDALGSRCDIVAPDYPSYGLSKGEPTEKSLVTVAAYYSLLAELNNKKLVIFGRSLGAAVALQTARLNLKVDGVILISPFMDLKTQIKELSVFGRFVSKEFYKLHTYDGLKAATQINAPTLLLHGGKDKLVKPYHSAELLARLILGKHYIIPGAGHNDIYQFEDTFRRIRDFLDANDLCTIQKSRPETAQ